MPHIRGHYRRGPWFRSVRVRTHYRKPQGMTSALLVGAVVAVVAVVLILATR